MIMVRWNGFGCKIAALATLSMLVGCARPVSDPEELKAIRTEAQSLLTNYPVKNPQGWVDVPKDRWPPTITALNPEGVKVDNWGVDILVKPDFDGGYGYLIPREKHRLPMLPKCYSERSEGVFWHNPC